MSDNLFEIDSAMNLIKEDIIRELSESVSKQNRDRFYKRMLSNRFALYEELKD